MSRLSLVGLLACVCLAATWAAPDPAPAPGPRGEARHPRYASGETVIVRYTREVRIKQGSLRGVALEPSLTPGLPNVDMFLGIPYAAPPVGSQRFMPPGSPPPWTGVRIADRFAPVCPQMLPDLGSEPGKTLSEGRYNSLKRLLPYLTNQSEDCLYLNIYTPYPDDSQGGSGRSSLKYPVLVFIHGESYEWNSGNPYDGSVLARYGGVVVITINFRLGILGFLKPGLGTHTVSNFGLWDQIAALQWVKENVAAFGGDPHSVTLVGHGTGAACANLLLVSPVSNGLFHRAILMSGSALADWALTHNPIQTTIQVAEALNCPSTEELARCLRGKRLAELMRVRVDTSPFKTPFGPVIDGSVVPNEPAHVMGVYNDLFSKYELLYGVTEVESYHLLDAVSLQMGMLEKERDHLLRQYVEARFEFLPDVALAKTLFEYNTQWGSLRHRSRPIVEQHRDALLDILSDARVASPLVQTANYHSVANPKSYFYVFTHRTKHGDFAEANVYGSIHGEELAYLFGVPMDSGRFPRSFTDQEKFFSELLITYWTNFAKTGTPNAPSKSKFHTMTRHDWRLNDLYWPEYDVTNQTYMNLGIPPEIGHQYRKQLMTFWNEVLPKQLKNPTTTKTRVVLPPPLLDTESPRMEVSPPWVAKPPQSPQDRFENFNKPYLRPPRPTQKPIYGKVIHEESNRGKGLMDGPQGKADDSPTDSPPATAGNSNMALSLVVIIGVCFLVVNVCAFAALFYQRGRLKIEERIMKRRLDESGRVEEGDLNPYAKRVKLLELKGEKGVKEGEGVYEAVSKQTASEALRRWRGQGSTSTVDAHTKVREWIQQEIVNRCSPRFMRRSRPANQRPLGASTETSFSQSTQMVPGSSAAQREASCKTPTSAASRVKKVSVAVDATPAARSASVQKQIPIELSKSLDALTTLGAATSPIAQRPILKRANTTMDDNAIKPEGGSPSPGVVRRSTTSINLLPFVPKPEEVTMDEDDVMPPIHHGHSHSEPIPFTVPFLADVASDVGPGNSQSMTPQIVGIPVEKDTASYKKDPPKQLSTFPKPTPGKPAVVKKDASVTTAGEDINVTSRDSYDEGKQGSSGEDPLTTIQRRKFPKVLPDLPSEDFVDDVYTPKQAAMKRRSLPPPTNLVVNLLTPVPEGDSSQPTTPTGKKPPPPPPRVSSTLGRKPSNTTPVAVGDVPKRPPVVVMPASTGAATSTPAVQRPEPKVIIKAAGNKNQVAPNKTVSQIAGGPRVTPTGKSQGVQRPNNQGTPVVRAAAAAAATSGGNGPQLRAVATPKVNAQAKAQANTVAAQKAGNKKNCETSTDEDSGSNTGTIKRAHKTDAKKK